jgi:hypothetical protein
MARAMRALRTLGCASLVRLPLGLAVAGWLAAPAAAECIPAALPHDYLQRQEDAGGHTLARHVGQPDRSLVARLMQDRRLRFASSYTDLVTAEDAIEFVLDRRRADINRWEQRAAATAELTIHGTLDRPVGHKAYRPATPAHVSERSTIVLVIKKIDDGRCLLLTSYPSF